MLLFVANKQPTPDELPKISPPHIPPRRRFRRLEGGWPSGGEDLAGGLGDTVGERELEVLGEKLLDVGAADIGGLLELNDLEDLFANTRQQFRSKYRRIRLNSRG